MLVVWSCPNFHQAHPVYGMEYMTPLILLRLETIAIRYDVDDAKVII